jgi:hypothetical protein
MIRMRLCVVLVLAGVVAFSFVQMSLEQAAASAEVILVRKFQTPGLFPVEGQYVSYGATVKNIGSVTLRGESLWATFRSSEGKDGSQASFQIPALLPGQSKELRLGPFKMVGSGQHSLYLGINRSGNAEEPNDLQLNYSAQAAANSFVVYSPATATAMPAGVAVAAAGVAILALYMRKRRD